MQRVTEAPERRLIPSRLRNLPSRHAGQSHCPQLRRHDGQLQKTVGRCFSAGRNSKLIVAISCRNTCIDVRTVPHVKKEGEDILRRWKRMVLSCLEDRKSSEGGDRAAAKTSPCLDVSHHYRQLARITSLIAPSTRHLA